MRWWDYFWSVILFTALNVVVCGSLFLLLRRDRLFAPPKDRRELPPTNVGGLGPRGSQGPVGHLHTFTPVEGSRVSACVCGSSMWTSR